MTAPIESVARINHLPGRYLAICPKCGNVRDSNEQEKEILRQKRGFCHGVKCEACEHSFTLHEGLLQRRLLYRGLPYPTSSGQISVIPWNPFIPVASVHNLRFRIGVTQRLDLSETYSEIYSTIAYEEGIDRDIIIEMRSVAPTILDIVSSARDENDIGKEARFTILVFGTSRHRRSLMWKELMGEALALIDKKSYKSSIIQSHAGLEAFIADFVEERLLRSGRPDDRWNEKTFKTYIAGDSRDSLPIVGILKVIVDQVLSIKLIGTEMFKDWSREGTGVKSLRNAIVHGDIEKYEEILDKRRLTEEEAAHWVLKTIMKLIYHIQYYELGA